MKEFLEPHLNGKYILVESDKALHQSWIAVPPSGASEYNFMYEKSNGDRVWSEKQQGFYGDPSWQRPTHPEPLPFIDDNPQSLNDQYAEIEQVRQNQKTTDAMREAEGILSGKKLKGVDATLEQRQSEYGCFEDVAFVTENIMSVLGHVRANGLSELPNTHRMALYMIASKMARIVNGDFNKLDSWHDIGGYAKLIENLIEGE